jgi:4a-hydroxytetrahydrobiopterin dehydratase
MYVPVTADAFDDLPDWAPVDGVVHAGFLLASFGSAGAFVAGIAEAADRADHHPDISVSYPGMVRLTMTTHARKGLTDADVRLAAEISELARRHGAAPQAPATD